MSIGQWPQSETLFSPIHQSVTMSTLLSRHNSKQPQSDEERGDKSIRGSNHSASPRAKAPLALSPQHDYHKHFYFWGIKKWFELRHKLTRLRFFWRWLPMALILAIPILVIAKRYPQVNINGVPALGLTIWFELSWLTVWISYLISWTLGWMCYFICRKEILDFHAYRSLGQKMRHSIVFLLWSIGSWALVPHMCYYARQHCNPSRWITVLERAFEATIVISVVWFIKALLLQLLYIKTGIKSMETKQTVLTNGAHSILLLATRSEKSLDIDADTDSTTGSVSDPTERAPGKSGLGGKATTFLNRIFFKIDSEHDQEKLKKALAPTNNQLHSNEKGHMKTPSTGQQTQGVNGEGSSKPFERPQKIIATEKEIWNKVSDILATLRCNEVDYLAPLRHIKDILRGYANKDHYQTLKTNIEQNFSKGFAKSDVTKHLEGLRMSLKSHPEIAEVCRVLSEFEAEADRNKRSTATQIWENLDLEDEKDKEKVTAGDLVDLMKLIGREAKDVIEGQEHLQRAVDDLDVIISLVYFLIIATLIVVCFFVKNPGTYLTLFWASFAGLSFAFQGPAQEFVSACIFVFSQHPYDINDWVKIMNGDKDTLPNLKVMEIRLLNTTFRYADNRKVVSIPHSRLSKERIENLSRWNMVDDIKESLVFDPVYVIKDINQELPDHAEKKMIIVEKPMLDAKYANPKLGLGCIEESKVINEIDLKKIKSLFNPFTHEHEQVTISALECIVNKHLAHFVRKGTALPVRRFYKTPKVEIGQTKDRDENMHVEITFTSRNFISGFEDEYSQTCREKVMDSVRYLLSHDLNVKLVEKKKETKPGAK
ncbi:hypothetical protein N431DRAFT_476004 [Stipitochalara longipes BDJ]|nr:hypothetical protein N431DRAFT_476004 [Stipitochalara longipes BDJ]